jgi:hypothetical protein
MVFRSLRFEAALIRPSISNAVAFNSFSSWSFKLSPLNYGVLGQFSSPYRIGESSNRNELRHTGCKKTLRRWKPSAAVDSARNGYQIVM